MSTQLKLFQHEKYETILNQLELNHVFPKTHQAMQVINQLIQEKRYPLAVKFLSLGFPARQAIWWAYLAAEHHDANEENLETQTALKHISEWVKNPNEPSRQTLKTLAEKLELKTPTAWAAMAAFWSDGNIAPDGKHEAFATENMCLEAVSNAIIIAAERSENPETQYQRFLKQGLHIGMGGNGRIF